MSALPKDIEPGKLPSPSEFSTEKAKFWETDITNNDLIKLYSRKGIAYRTINKQVKLMFKNGWTSEDATALTISDTFNFNQYVKHAYKQALVSGYSLIYCDYADDGQYDMEAPKNARAVGYFVITRAWVFEDIYVNQEVRDYYTIYRADGTTFKLHKSRVVRVQPEDFSKLLPAYDSLQVLDNTLWGLGQTMFRSGSGFPVLKVKNSGSIVKTEDGEQISRLKFYKKMGFLRDMNTQTGFIIDSEDTLTFEGAQGKAIQPGEYYDRAFQQCAVDLDVPVDILKGVQAGALTGSETNLKEYYGDLAALQIEHLEPIFDSMFYTQQYYKKIEYKWQPIFEQTQTEIVNNLKSDVDAVHKLELYGYYTHEQAVNYFADNYEILDYNPQEINTLKGLPTYEKQVSSGLFGGSDSVAKDEESALPSSEQKIEKKYMSEMDKAFATTQANMVRLLQAFNTDSAE